MIGVSYFWPLDAGIGYVWPEFRILCKIFSPRVKFPGVESWIQAKKWPKQWLCLVFVLCFVLSLLAWVVLVGPGGGFGAPGGGFNDSRSSGKPLLLLRLKNHPQEHQNHHQDHQNLEKQNKKQNKITKNHCLARTLIRNEYTVGSWMVRLVFCIREKL